ncbi:MAG: hypothetical protein WCP70_05210 [Methanothrix sp.]
MERCKVNTTAKSSGFQDLIEAVESLPLEDRSLLVEIVNKRIIEKRRAELVSEVMESRDAFRQGNLKRGTVEDLMKDLLD